MEQKTFRTLTEEIARLSGLPEVTRVSDFAQLEVDDTSFTLIEGVELDAGTVAYFCDFGPIPENPDRAEILQRLLECNLLMFGVGTPTFCVNFETEHVLLTGRADLKAIDAQRLLNAFAQFSAQAKLWRQTYFLEGERKTRSKTHHRLLMAVENQ